MKRLSPLNYRTERSRLVTAVVNAIHFSLCGMNRELLTDSVTRKATGAIPRSGSCLNAIRLLMESCGVGKDNAFYIAIRRVEALGLRLPIEHCHDIRAAMLSSALFHRHPFSARDIPDHCRYPNGRTVIEEMCKVCLSSLMVTSAEDLPCVTVCRELKVNFMKYRKKLAHLNHLRYVSGPFRGNRLLKQSHSTEFTISPSACNRRSFPVFSEQSPHQPTS